MPASALVASSPAVLTAEVGAPVSSAASSSAVLTAESTAEVEPTLGAERIRTKDFTHNKKPPDTVLTMSSWVGNAGAGTPTLAGRMKNNNSPAFAITNRPEHSFPPFAKAMSEVLRHAPSTPDKSRLPRGAAIKAPRQRFDHKQARPGPPPIEDLQHLDAMTKLIYGRQQLEELVAEQKRQNEAKWEKLGAMPPPPEEVAAPERFLDESYGALPALEDAASESLALAGSTARLAFSALEAASAAPNTYVAGIESFLSKEGALFDAIDDDGRGGGVFVLSEQNVNRSVSFAVPVVLTAERAEDEAEERQAQMMKKNCLTSRIAATTSPLALVRKISL